MVGSSAEILYIMYLHYYDMYGHPIQFLGTGSSIGKVSATCLVIVHALMSTTRVICRHQ